MIFKNIKSAHEHFNFPGSYRHGTIITNNLAIRIYSNMESAPDYFNKSKSIFYYTIKTTRRLEAFKQNKKENKPIHVFVKDKENKSVIYYGKFKVSGFRDGEKYVALRKY
jgi:hypothetical protein